MKFLNVAILSILIFLSGHSSRALVVENLSHLTVVWHLYENGELSYQSSPITFQGLKIPNTSPDHPFEVTLPEGSIRLKLIWQIFSLIAYLNTMKLGPVHLEADTNAGRFTIPLEDIFISAGGRRLGFLEVLNHSGNMAEKVSYLQTQGVPVPWQRISRNLALGVGRCARLF